MKKIIGLIKGLIKFINPYPTGSYYNNMNLYYRYMTIPLNNKNNNNRKIRDEVAEKYHYIIGSYFENDKISAKEFSILKGKYVKELDEACKEFTEDIKIDLNIQKK